MLKKKILIIGSSEDIIKTFSYLYKNNQVTNLSFRKVWDRPHLIRYYDTIICSGFHHNICFMNSRILHGYVQKYYYFILKLKKNCKKLYLVSTSISVDISISKVVFFYYLLNKKISLYKNVSIISFDTIVGHEKKISGFLKFKLLNFFNIKTLHYKKMISMLNKPQKKISIRKIKFFFINIPRGRLIDRVLRIVFDLFLFKFYSIKLKKKGLN